MMQPPPILVLEEEKPAGVDWFKVEGGRQNSLINYVMEKCLSLLHVWGGWNVCEHLFLMRREADDVEHAVLLKREL